MMIENVSTSDLGRIIEQLVMRGLGFTVRPAARMDDAWDVELTGAY